MIYKNGKLILEILQGPIPITVGAVYRGDLLVWRSVYKSTILSCYGGGTWRQDLPWLDTDSWKNNN